MAVPSPCLGSPAWRSCGAGSRSGRWLREAVRGVSAPFDQTMAVLKDQLDKNILRYRQPLMIPIVVAEPATNKRFFGGFTNVLADARTLLPEFNCEMVEWETPGHFSMGTGRAVVLNDGHAAVLDAHVADPGKGFPLHHLVVELR